MTLSPPSSFRRQMLTASVAVFLTWGVILSVSGGLAAGGVAVLMRNRFIFMSARADAELFGLPIAQLYAANPALKGTVTIYMTMLSAALGAMGIAVVSLAWFGLRRGSRGALAGLVLTPLPLVTWFLVVLERYRASGVRIAIADVPPFVWLSAVVALVGGVLGWKAVGSSNAA